MLKMNLSFMVLVTVLVLSNSISTSPLSLEIRAPNEDLHLTSKARRSFGKEIHRRDDEGYGGNKDSGPDSEDTPAGPDDLPPQGTVQDATSQQPKREGYSSGPPNGTVQDPTSRTSGDQSYPPGSNPTPPAPDQPDDTDQDPTDGAPDKQGYSSGTDDQSQPGDDAPNGTVQDPTSRSREKEDAAPTPADGFAKPSLDASAAAKAHAAAGVNGQANAPSP
ncbi:hypothetical protein PtB15_4B763 [Puccinia triticina]|nr:hypothetical protein PtB15_4B763 [Puccinia triticina]